MKKLLVLLFAFNALTVSAQSVRGRVIDEREAPVAFANVLAFSSDSVYLKGTTTNERGEFELNLSTVPHTIRVSYVGYQEARIRIQNPAEYLTVKLTENSTAIEAVTVTAKAEPFTQSHGVVTANVAVIPLLKNSGTIDRLLNNIPFVYGGGGSYDVFGAGSAELYLNGRRLRDARVLETLRSQDIQKVEVIHSPGAEEGGSVRAVIKIYTLRPNDGLQVAASEYLQMGCRLSSSTSATMVYRENKFDWTANAMYSNTNMKMAFDDELTIASPESKTVNSGGIDYNNNFLSGGLGMNYAINERSNIGFTSSMSYGRIVNDILSAFMHYSDGALVFDDEIKTLLIMKPVRGVVTGYYNFKLGKTDVDLTNDFVVGGRSQSQSYVETDAEVTTANRQDYWTNATLLKLSSPLFGGSLGYGGEVAFTQNRSRFDFTQDNISTGMSNSIIDRNQFLAAVYGDYSYVLGKFQLNAGLRYEYLLPTYIVNGSVSEISNFNNHNLYPSARVSYSDRQRRFSVDLSYRRMATKPSYATLNNNIFMESRYTYQQNNASLKDVIQDRFSLVAGWRDFRATVTYSDYKNGSVVIFYPYGDEAVLKRTENIPHYSVLSVGVNWRKQFDFYYPTVQVVGGRQWFNGLNKPYVSVSVGNYFELPKQWAISFGASYGSRSYSLYSLTSPLWGYSVSVSKEIGKFTMYLTVNNLGLNRDRISSRTINDITSWSLSTNDDRSVGFNISYRINNIKVRYRNSQRGSEVGRL